MSATSGERRGVSPPVQTLCSSDFCRRTGCYQHRVHCYLRFLLFQDETSVMDQQVVNRRERRQRSISFPALPRSHRPPFHFLQSTLCGEATRDQGSGAKERHRSVGSESGSTAVPASVVLSLPFSPRSLRFPPSSSLSVHSITARFFPRSASKTVKSPENSPRSANRPAFGPPGKPCNSRGSAHEAHAKCRETPTTRTH